MNWFFPIALAFFLSGCSWFSWGSDDEPATLPPSKPSSSTPVDVYADAADRVMDVAAAAIQVARDANQAGKPVVVESELGVASSVLPRATPSEVAKAKARADKADPKEYTRAQAEADQAQRRLDELWAQVESEKEKARQQVLAAKQELDAERAKFRDLLWSVAGIGLVVLGGAALVWGSALGVTKAEAAAIILVGFAVGSLPWILESEMSVWIIAPAAGLVALRGVVWAWSLGWKKKKPVTLDHFQTKPAHPDAKSKEVPADSD